MNRNTILVLAVVALLVIYLTKQAKSVASSAVNAKAGAVNSVITGGFGLATSLLDVLAGRHSSSGGTKHSTDGGGIVGGSVHSNPVIGDQDGTASMDPDGLMPPSDEDTGTSDDDGGEI